ncbi:hypothetical protein [Nocardia sp. NPDC002869]|uniref:hypothetical protein n=1 Tax=Nocardia sp. NPDC002869 TaxID=3161032 RepID=UPI00398CED98
MDRPPSGPADGEHDPRDHTGPPRERDPRTAPEPGYANPDPYGRTGPPGQWDPHPSPAPGYADQDPATPHPDLYRPHHGGPAGSPVPADSMPTEPIPVLRLPGWDSGNAHYEGSWSDWVARAGAGAAEPEGATAEDPGVIPPPAVDTRPSSGAAAAAETTVATENEPVAPTTDTSPAGARERLRRRLTPPDHTTPAPVRATAPTSGRSRVLPVLLGVAGVAALGAAAYVQFAIVGGDEPRAPAAAAPSATAPAAPGADPHCVAERVGNTVQGNEPGGTDSGPSAIFGFQHAYYVARSGEQARALVAGDAAVPPAADIQRGIDTIPEGTTYCVRIAPGAFVGQYTVTITEYRPGSAPLGYNPQLVTTMRIGDRTLITGIGPMP